MTKIESTKVKAYGWSLTVWHSKTPPELFKEYLAQALASHPKWSIHGQQEEGEKSGKPHYQLFLKTPDQPRKSTLIKFFPAVHIESENNRAALEKYVHKEETRTGEFKSVERSHITFKETCLQFFRYLERQDLIDEKYTTEERLALWDEFIELSVGEGIVVDIIGVNPQYRSCIGKYWNGYITQYTRQDNKTQDTPENSVAPLINAPKESIQEESNKVRKKTIRRIATQDVI